MKLLIALIKQLMNNPDDDILEYFISQYSDAQINDAVCFIRAAGK